MQHAHSFPRAHAHDGDGKLIAQQLDGVHYLTLFYRCAGEQGMELVNDKDSGMAHTEKVYDLIPELCGWVSCPVGSEEALKNGNI